MQQGDAIEGKGKGKVWFHLLEFIFYSKARFDRDYVFLDQDGVREKQNYRGRQKLRYRYFCHVVYIPYWKESSDNVF